MLTNLFTKKGTRKRDSAERGALERLRAFNVDSANATLVEDAAGAAVDVDLGRVAVYRTGGRMLMRDRAFYITGPDGAGEDGAGLQGRGEIVRLWFLYERIPRVVDCEVLDRVRLSADEYPALNPSAGVGYRVRPVGEVVKRDKRTSLRFSHRPGGGPLPVYPQILFDVFVTLTDLALPTSGALNPRIEDLKVRPYRKPQRSAAVVPAEAVVGRFKNAMKGNLPGDQTVHVSKPHFDEKHDRTVLLELGYADVLGLGSPEIGRTLHIKKPLPSRTKDRRDPNHLSLDDTLILHYGARAPLSGENDYYQIVTEIARDGLENITIRPIGEERSEPGLRLPLIDFSVDGFRFAAGDDFLRYALPEHAWRLDLEGRAHALQERVFRFNFYPRLRFNHDIEGYRPELPRMISVLGRIVRSEIVWEDEEERTGGRFRTLGVQLAYDPAEYSVDTFDVDTWELIRPFNENPYFKDVHKSLNGLIAYLEAQSREITGDGGEALSRPA